MKEKGNTIFNQGKLFLKTGKLSILFMLFTENPPTYWKTNTYERIDRCFYKLFSMNGGLLKNHSSHYMHIALYTFDNDQSF
jgi:hypothetical protein